MYEFKCAYCGKVKRVLRSCDVGRFCSKSCAAKWGNVQRYGAEKIHETFECVFQPESIMCDRQICSRCGWNPAVAKARLEEIIETRFADASTLEEHTEFAV